MPLVSLTPHTTDASPTSDVPELFVLGVWISNTSVRTLLLKLKAGTVTLVNNSPSHEYVGLDKVVEVTDGLLQELGPESENTNDVIFVVDQSWVVDGDISSEKKPYIKAITTDLDLSPIGFVDQTEAVTNFAIQNNPRFSGIFAFVESTSVSLTVVEHASITGTKVVGRSSEVAKDVAEGLARFAKADDERASYLPPQLFLLSLEESEASLKEMQQGLLSEPLTQAAKFLQSPMISVVTQSEFIARIVQEAGVAIADAKGLASAKQKASIPLRDQVVAVPDETANVRPVSAAELGFTEVQSKAEMAKTEDFSTQKSETAVDEIPTSFGIPIVNQAMHHNSSPIHSTSKNTEKDVAEPTPVQQAQQKAGMGFFHRHHKNTNLFAGIGVGLGVLVLGLIVLLTVFFRSTAVIAVTLATKVITTDATIEVDATLAQTDVENAVLAAQKVSHTVSGKNAILTTGVKVVGENAKGTITIYNKTIADKDFSAGTIVKTDNLTYTLDEDITVPASTVTETTSGEKKDYGSAEVAVTATDIGADGNISKETELTVGSFADTTYSARTKNDFSGGSSREVRVVSASDQAEAVKELQKELEDQAASELQAMLESGEYLLPGFTILAKEVEYSSDIDDEVNEVTASLTITVEALMYTLESLKPLAAVLLASQVDDGYVLSSEPPSILSKPAPNTDASASATFILANITSEAIPVLDLESLYEYVLGKKLADAVRNLEDHQSISEVDIQISPGLISTIPKDASRVELRITEVE